MLKCYDEVGAFKWIKMVFAFTDLKVELQLNETIGHSENKEHVRNTQE